MAALAGDAGPAAAAPVLIRSRTPAYVIDEPGLYVLAGNLNAPATGSWLPTAPAA